MRKNNMSIFVRIIAVVFLYSLFAIGASAEPVPACPVSVDIKPESCPNPLNLKSKGVLPVAVLGTEFGDVITIDPASILLSREGFGGVAPIRSGYEDVATPFVGVLCDCNTCGPDGWMDLTLKFKIQELVSALELDVVAGQTIPLTLTGELYDGTPFTGEDCVLVLGKP